MKFNINIKKIILNYMMKTLIIKNFLVILKIKNMTRVYFIKIKIKTQIKISLN